MEQISGDLVSVASAFRWIAAYTYPIVFVGTLVDASGVPFPGRVLLVAAGAVAAAGHASVVVVIVLGAIAAMVMDHGWYFAGRRGGQRLVPFVRRLIGPPPRRNVAATDYLGRYGAATIVLGRFFTSLRIVAWPLAAAHGVGYTKFLVLDLVGATLWTSTWVLLGWAVGDRWRPTAEAAGVWLAAAGALVFGLTGIAVAVRVWRGHWR